jgi:DNA-binding transcriptional ArsR family regulator
MKKSKLAPATGKRDIALDYAELRKAVLVLRALNHRLRQQIIKLIESSEKITVTEVYKKMNIEQAVASQHLAILRRARVVTTERQGKFIFYRVDKERVMEIAQMLVGLVAEDSESSRALLAAV